MKTVPSTVPDDDLEAEIEKAEKECLNARAQYILRQAVVEDTIIAAPILNALHAGNNASATERRLRPLLDRRDALEIASTNLSTSLQAIDSKIPGVQKEFLKTKERNRPLAAEIMDLTEKINERNDKVKEQPKIKKRLEEVKGEADTAVRQWRIMKRVVSAVVAGSGVNWAEDDGLRDLVLDAEDEND